MIISNLLLKFINNGFPVGIEKALEIKGAHVHVYGKTATNIGRKMGHVTAIGSNIAEAENLATKAASLICFGEGK